MSKKKKSADEDLSDEQIKQILERIIQDTDSSIIRYINTESQSGPGKSKRKTTTYRVCPMCDRAVGNFGTNFKNHFRKCCPIIYDELTKYQPLYFGTWNQLIENGLIKGKVIEDDEELELELRRTSNYHELCQEEGIAPVVGSKRESSADDESDDDAVGGEGTHREEDEDDLKKFMKSLAKEQKKSSRSRKKKKDASSSSNAAASAAAGSTSPTSSSSAIFSTTPATPRFGSNVTGNNNNNLVSPYSSSSLFSPQSFSSPMIGMFSPATGGVGGGASSYPNDTSWLLNPSLFVNQAIEDVKQNMANALSLDLGSEDFTMLNATSKMNTPSAQQNGLTISETWDETVYKQALHRYLRNNAYIQEIFFGKIEQDGEYDNCAHMQKLTKALEKMIEHNDNELERDEKIIDTFISTQQEFYSTINSITKDTDENELREKKRILSQILSKQHYHSQAAKKPKQDAKKELIEL
ncbi:hypothetical protein FDP41_004741 [Naegleria fowleri]|uniref:Uncharacterized protein n=1 Tax=Naegleria fowleri TaxID=5763 RepID=A0A6A5BRM8_NAEFO|nr:uncharacterized protein FDP41_004741 [Naegleria fowleri]KAF0976065.1 hypothetical protein FDP41_004741 [Naegleria fowleri]CAG4714333.1 unnamed protein product [Naegleria fowleri]